MEVKKLLAICVLIAVVSAAEEKARFDNYRVYQVTIENESQLSLMKHIQDNSDSYDFMHFPHGVKSTTELMVPPHKFSEWSEFVENFNLKTRLLTDNLQKVYDDEMQQNMRNRRSEFNWNSYWTLNQMYEFIESVHLSHPQDTEIFQYGTSFEGRPLEGIKVNIGGESGKKAIVIEGLMHAREWISGATVTWMLDHILVGSDPTIDDVVKRYVWYFLPVTNPDGYAYTWSTNRNWRKTRKPSSVTCYGSDPNRNWDNHFNQGGTSTNPCSDTYPGPSPFSEPETKALSDYLSTIPNLNAYFSFHAYGQMMMTPPGWTKELTGNYQQLYDIGTKALQSLTAKFGTQYSLGSIANVIYIATGSSVDWVAEGLHTNVSYAYEMRDTGRYGFQLPTSEIVPNSIEVFASVITAMREAYNKGIA